MINRGEIISYGYITVPRLIKRGLIKNLKAFRHKIIPATEIERLLKETL